MIRGAREARARFALATRARPIRIISSFEGNYYRALFASRVLCIFLPTLSGDDRRGPSGNLLLPSRFAWLLSAVLLLFLFLENLIAEPRRRL